MAKIYCKCSSEAIKFVAIIARICPYIYCVDLHAIEAIISLGPFPVYEGLHGMRIITLILLHKDTKYMGQKAHDNYRVVIAYLHN